MKYAASDDRRWILWPLHLKRDIRWKNLAEILSCWNSEKIPAFTNSLRCFRTNLINREVSSAMALPPRRFSALTEKPPQQKGCSHAYKFYKLFPGRRFFIYYTLDTK